MTIVNDSLIVFHHLVQKVLRTVKVFEVDLQDLMIT